MIEDVAKMAVWTKIQQGKSAFEAIKTDNCINHICIDIDCALLTDPEPLENTNRMGSPKFGFYSKLPGEDKPCLYFFEFDSSQRDAILTEYISFVEYQQFASPGDFRKTAALKKRPPLKTNVLYVGKRKKEMGGRLVVHLGYYDVGTTAGLQLRFWAKKLGLKFKLHILYFEKDMYDFIDPLEIALARSLNPLIGKL